MCCRAQEQLQARLEKEHTRERDALLKELERAHQQHRDAVQQAQQGTAWYSGWCCGNHCSTADLVPLCCVHSMCRGINFCAAAGFKGALMLAVPGPQEQHQ